MCLLLLRTSRLSRISVDYLLDVDSMAETDGCFVVSKLLFHIRIRVAFELFLTLFNKLIMI